MNNKTLKSVVALVATVLLVCSCAFAATIGDVTYDAETGALSVPFAAGEGATKAILLVKNASGEIVAAAQFNNLTEETVAFNETIDTTKVTAGDTLAISVGDNADGSTLAATAEYAIPVLYKVTYGETVTEYAAGTAIADVLPKDVPTKDADEQYTYTFNKWLVNGVEVAEDAKLEGDITITADFTATAREYTVTWVVEGVETTETYAYGAMPEYKGEAPVKAGDAQYSYNFVGWGEIAEVTGDATYTAKFEAVVNEYTITFVYEGGEVISTQTLAYGSEIEVADPTKAEDENFTYEFAGWNPALATVTGDATYTATFNAVEKEPEVETFTVTFVSEGATVEEVAEVAAGTALSTLVPAEPTKAASGKKRYAFIGWYLDDAFATKMADNTVVADTTLYAKFSMIGVHGDATADGNVNAMDTVEIKKYLRDKAGYASTYPEKANSIIADCQTGKGKTARFGDATADGNVNAMDVVEIKKYLKNKTTGYSGYAATDMTIVKD